MLGELLPRVPKTYGRYIEPFFGGGALFFSLKPENAIIADSNPELINMYLQVAHNVDDVIECLQKYENTSEMFYEVRSLDWQKLPNAEAAARTIYLNKTCFNGLYRVNRSGQFNTPFGRIFLKADTFPAVQECFLRAMSVEQFEMPDKTTYFSPLRWMLAIMLELEKRTGSTEMSRIEFALWGHTTNPSYDLSEVVDHILDLRQRRAKAPAKRTFDKNEIKERGKHYNKKSENFTDYCDMNMRYLRISGMFQRKGRGIMIVPAKHLLAEKLAKSTATSEPLMEAYKKLCSGASLPTDNFDVAKTLLEDLKKQMKERHIVYDISDLPLNTPAEINIARQRLEDTLAKTDEIQYANDQCNQWQEIADYMSLLIKGGGKKEYNEDYAIEIPKDETPAYFEWTLWRAALAIDHMVNKPYEIRGFRLDSDFLPVTAAGGGKGDLYCEFENFMILTEVTMSTSSRQEAMEGEPVRRHVSDAVLNYNKPVYGLFLAIRIDTNTAETFRHGIWYAKGDVKQRLDIVPLTLEQFRRHFVSMFEGKQAHPEHLRDLILQCETERDNLEAPAWMQYIDDIVTRNTLAFSNKVGV